MSKAQGYVNITHFCQGHNVELQNYLRVQSDHMRSHDLVTLCVELLHSIVFDINEKSIDMIIQLLETLDEFCQGCVGNQIAVFDAQVVEDINYILRLTKFGKCEPYKVCPTKKLPFQCKINTYFSI